MMAQAIKAGAELKQAEADSIKRKGKSFIVKTSENTYESRAIILASGLKHRKLNIKGEKEFTGKGVSYCVTCDGPLFAEKDVVVIGASNSAVMAALMLKEYAKSVTILSRSQPSADAASLEQIKKSNKVSILNGEPSEIKGNKFVNAIKLSNGKEIKADGVFIEVGLEPFHRSCKAVKA